MGRTILLERRQTKSVGRWDDCPAFCDLIGRGQSLAESGRGNGLGRSENKRPETFVKRIPFIEYRFPTEWVL
ncbi:hypothetical protein TNCV_3252101 [Trichonephila clavipes]|nr:hypothetical protein TNCV_3252101 [Trichonephila clavipes]